MSSYSLSNILLPAVFVSSAVFSTLTVPFALIKSEPVVIELPPLYSGEIQPIFDGNHKEVAIPYIGFAIVVSVGAGMATVEVIRRWHQFRESVMIQEESSNSSEEKPNSPENAAQPEALTLPEYRPEVSAIDLLLDDEGFSTQSLITPDAIPEAEDIAVETAQPLVEFQPTLSDQTPVLTLIKEKPNLSLVPQGDNVVQFESHRVSSQSTISDLDLAVCEILESREQYQTCRLQVPHLKRRVFAIGVNGQYYSFLRAEKTQDKVLEVLTKLGDRVGKTVITKTEKGYAIWAWEPEAS